MRVAHEFALNRVSVNIVTVMCVVATIANSMICEAALPDFSLAAQDGAKSVRISALDQLHSMFERNVMARSQQEVNMFRHHDEGVELEAAFAAVAIDCLQKEANVILNDKESSTLPRGKRHEIRSGRGDESSRLQERTSAAEAAVIA